MKKIVKNIIFSTIVGLLAVVLLLYKIYPSLTQNNNHTVNVPPVKEDLSQKSIISEVKIDEKFFNSMDEKELIHYKLLNSIDFFSSVEGQLNTFNIFFGNSTVTYAIDIKNNQSHITTNEDEKDLDYICNNGKAIELNNSEKTIEIFNVLMTKMP